MNIPQIYLVEPYNAYAPKQKKKHWMQEVEEQSLLAKIIAEQQALQEAAQRTSNTLPPQAPPTAQAGSQGYSGGEGAAGGPNTTGGGGGAPRPQFYHPNMSITPGVVSSTGSVPSQTQFFSTGDQGTMELGAVTINWVFGDGTTGGGPSPLHSYTTIGNFTVQFTASSVNDPTNVTTASFAVTMSAPALTAAFVPSGTSVVFTSPFYTASINNLITFTPSTNPVPVTYAWTLGSGSLTSTATVPTVTYTNTGTYTVGLTVSDGLGNSAVGSRKIQVTPAVLAASIASPPNNDTGAAPLAETFVNGTVIPGISNPVTWKWSFGSGSLASETTLNPAAPVTFTNPGTFVTKLEATGSDGQKSATSINVIAT
jgi:PKD repeat protein